MLPIGTIDGIVLSDADIRAISFGVYPRKSSILVLLFTFVMIEAKVSICLSDSNTTFLFLNSSVISESIPSIENSLNTMYISSVICRILGWVAVFCIVQHFFR